MEGFLRIADADGNGKIDRNEWKEILKKLRYMHPISEQEKVRKLINFKQSFKC